MNRRTKQIGAALALLAMAIFASGSFWFWVRYRVVSDAVRARLETIVEKHPEVKPAWDSALADQRLTQAEAEEIARLAGEKLEP